MIKRFFVLLTASLAILAALEFGARLYLVEQFIPRNLPANEDELLRGVGQIRLKMQDGGYFVHSDVHSPAFNIDNGARRITDQPAVYTRTIWLFGNSALADYYASDADTAASRLQALVKVHQWRVMNLAVNGYRASSQLARLRDTAILPGDLVIFVDGATDAYTAFTRCTPVAPFNSYAIAEVFCDAVNWAVQSDLSPDVERYQQSIDTAQQYSVSHGATFYHLFQVDNPDRASHWAIDRFYKALIEKPVRLIASADLFVDEVHLLPAGDAVVARAIYDAILLTF